MSGYVRSSDLVTRAARGEIPALSRLISRAESGEPEARPALAEIYRRAGQAHIIGITGVPGSGKSTLVASIAAQFRSQGTKVGIVAVDPSSPYSGGAILGDRIRMSDLGNDPGVYIRSMATRGAVGGMARATLDAVDIIDVAGFETIIIETVGVGQDEVEIAQAAHTTAVVSAPGLGDAIQALKAGMLEIADIHVVSKSDRGDAERTFADLKHMLALGASHSTPGHWLAPVLGISAFTGAGVQDLVNALVQHRTLVASQTEAGRRRRRRIAEFRLRKTAETLMLERFDRAAAMLMAPFAERLHKREADPYTLAGELLAASRQQLSCT
jgi:LAO/AO transport system kinase